MLNILFQLIKELFYIVIFLFIFVLTCNAILSFFRMDSKSTAEGLNEKKGVDGEKEVRQELNKLDKSKYKVFNDIYIPYKNSKKTTQCDHVIVSIYGVFVIETKNYSGKVVGKVKDEKWTQILGTKEYKFYNPLMQNETHIKALSDYLGLNTSKCISIVTFCNRCDIAGVKKIKKVTNTTDLLDLIKSNKTVMFNDLEVKRMSSHIRSLPKSKTISENHKKYVKSIKRVDK